MSAGPVTYANDRDPIVCPSCWGTGRRPIPHVEQRPGSFARTVTRSYCERCEGHGHLHADGTPDYARAPSHGLIQPGD